VRDRPATEEREREWRKDGRRESWEEAIAVAKRAGLDGSERKRW